MLEMSVTDDLGNLQVISSASCLYDPLAHHRATAVILDTETGPTHSTRLFWNPCHCHPRYPLYSSVLRKCWEKSEHKR
jgi:hypothetical protein